MLIKQGVTVLESIKWCKLLFCYNFIPNTG